MQGTCSVKGCLRRHRARGWCYFHYQRWYLKGTPTPVPPTVDERFFAHVSKGTKGCWIWWRLRPDGYGIKFNPARGQSHLPHRWSYQFFRAEIPTGLVIDHLCENRACVNPWHLEPVTQKVNDRRARRREAKDQVPSWAA